MRKILLTAFGVLAFVAGSALPAFGQCQSYTTVTGTVIDPHSIPYQTATVTADLFPPGVSTPTCTPLSGGTRLQFSTHIGPTPLDNNGSFTLNLPPNSIITPTTQWTIHIAIAPGVILPWGTGPQAFDYTVTIAGATQDLSAPLTALAPALTKAFGGGGSITDVTGVAPIVVTPTGSTRVVSCPLCAQGTIANALQYSPTYYTAPGSNDILGGLSPPTTFGVWQEVWNTGTGGAVAPTFQLSGVPVDSESAASGTVVGDATGTDRATLLLNTNNTTSTAWAVPAPFGSNFPFVQCNAGTVVLTDTPASSTVNGNATLKMQGQPSGGNPPCAFWWSDPTNWHAGLIPATDANGLLPGASLETQYTQLECLPGLGDGLNAIAAGTYLQLNCVNRSGVTWTILGINCYTDNAGSSTLNAANNAATGLLTGAITCNSTKSGGGQAGTQSATTTLANNDAINFTFVADGTSKQTTWTILLKQ